MTVCKNLFFCILFLQCLAWGFTKVRYPYYSSFSDASRRPHAEELNVVFCKIDFIRELISRHPEKISSLANKDLDEVSLMLSLVDFKDESSLTARFRDFLRSEMNSQDYLASFLSGIVHKYIEDEDGKLVIYPKQFASSNRWRSAPSTGGVGYGYFHLAKIFKINIDVVNRAANQGGLSVSFVVPIFGDARNHGYLQLLASMREGYYFCDEKKTPYAPLEGWHLLSHYFIIPYAPPYEAVYKRGHAKIVIEIPLPKSMPPSGELSS